MSTYNLLSCPSGQLKTISFSTSRSSANSSVMSLRAMRLAFSCTARRLLVRLRTCKRRCWAVERRAASLERELSDLVNEAYGLTPEEVDLLWKTARMPRL